MRNYKKISKFISLILRHRPEVIGIRLDENGWADVSELLAGINKKGHEMDMHVLEEVMAANDKKRFVFNEDKTKIRAVHGHSVDVDLELMSAVPPDILYHGTAERFVKSIKGQGIMKQQRLYVHLSSNTERAGDVGRRHGKPVILKIDAKTMHQDGYDFYCTENGDWLTEEVPVQYIIKPERKKEQTIITVTNRANMINFSLAPHKDKTAVISISDEDKEPPDLFNHPKNGIIAQCKLRFGDADNEENGMTEADAAKIAEFVNTAGANADRIIVHCEAGVSRSAGVAAAIMKFLTGDDKAIFNNRKYVPNMFCYRLVLDALHAAQGR